MHRTSELVEHHRPPVNGGANAAFSPPMPFLRAARIGTCLAQRQTRALV